jgi:hypothetical protein
MKKGMYYIKPNKKNDSNYHLKLLILFLVFMILVCFFKIVGADLDGWHHQWKDLYLAKKSGGSSHGTLHSNPSCGTCAAKYDGGSITLSTNPNPGDTTTIGGTTITFVSSGATGNQVNIGVDNVTTTANLLTMLQASPDSNLIKYGYAALGSDGVSFGTLVTLTATCNPGYTFTGWTVTPQGGCSGTGTCTVTMFADTQVVSHCDPNG